MVKMPVPSEVSLPGSPRADFCGCHHHFAEVITLLDTGQRRHAEGPRRFPPAAGAMTVAFDHEYLPCRRRSARMYIRGRSITSKASSCVLRAAGARHAQARDWHAAASALHAHDFDVSFHAEAVAAVIDTAS